MPPIHRPEYDLLLQDLENFHKEHPDRYGATYQEVYDFPTFSPSVSGRTAKYHCVLDLEAQFKIHRRFREDGRTCEFRIGPHPSGKLPRRGARAAAGGFETESSSPKRKLKDVMGQIASLFQQKEREGKREGNQGGMLLRILQEQHRLIERLTSFMAGAPESPRHAYDECRPAADEKKKDDEPPTPTAPPASPEGAKFPPILIEGLPAPYAAFVERLRKPDYAEATLLNREPLADGVARLLRFLHKKGWPLMSRQELWFLLTDIDKFDRSIDVVLAALKGRWATKWKYGSVLALIRWHLRKFEAQKEGYVSVYDRFVTRIKEAVKNLQVTDGPFVLYPVT